MSGNWKNLGIERVALRVGAVLEKHGITATLVGGGCVSIYTDNKYLSHDLDFVSDSDLKTIEAALREIGFHKKNGRLFERVDCEFILDFVPAPVAVGREPVTETETISSDEGTVRLLTPTDCVKDRLSAYYHWNDHPSLEQAVMVALRQKNKIDFDDVRRWSELAHSGGKYEYFQKLLEEGGPEQAG